MPYISTVSYDLSDVLNAISLGKEHSQVFKYFDSAERRVSMPADISELLVGAYLKVINHCDFVAYNTHPPGGGMRGLEEIDVVGLKLDTRVAYLCEVATHLHGLRYGNDNDETVNIVLNKMERLRNYANDFLVEFPTRYFMFWSPVVPNGYITQRLNQVQGFEAIINNIFTQRISELKEEARRQENDEGNDVFRLLQILEHLR